MTVTGVYIGYGAIINYEKIAEILGIELDYSSSDEEQKVGQNLDYNLKNKNDNNSSIPIKSDSDSDKSDSDFDKSDFEEYNYDHLSQISQYLEKFPIYMSKSNIPLVTVNYPHTSEEYEKKEIAIGIFMHVMDDDNNNVSIESQLKNMLQYGLNKSLFKQKFQKTPNFMVIIDDCRCCS
jgi:hypothetical protein